MSELSLSSTDYQDLAKELGTIQELDDMIKEKQAYLNLLVQQRLAIEKGLDPFFAERQQKVVEDEEDEASSTPSFLLTMQQGPILKEKNQQGFSGSSSSQDPLQTSTSLPKNSTSDSHKPLRDFKFPVKKDFEKSDFVNRNKALGPGAKYFSTLTPREQDRVEAILAIKEEDEETINDAASEMTSSTLKSSSTAYTIDEESSDRLQYIHKKLGELLPHLDPSQDFWSTFDNGSTTSESANLKAIEQALEKLNFSPSNAKSLTQGEIDSLMLGCMKEQISAQGKASPSAES